MEHGMRLDDVVLSSVVCLGQGIEPLKLRAYQIGDHIDANPACAFSTCRCEGYCPCESNDNIRNEGQIFQSTVYKIYYN